MIIDGWEVNPEERTVKMYFWGYCPRCESEGEDYDWVSIDEILELAEALRKAGFERKEET